MHCTIRLSAEDLFITRNTDSDHFPWEQSTVLYTLANGVVLLSCRPTFGMIGIFMRCYRVLSLADY